MAFCSFILIFSEEQKSEGIKTNQKKKGKRGKKMEEPSKTEILDIQYYSIYIQNIYKYIQK